MPLPSPLTTTKRVIHWVHRHPANRRANSLPAPSTSFSKLDILIVQVSHLTNARCANSQDLSQLAARQPNNHVLSIFLSSNHCRKGTGRAYKLTTLTRAHLDVVDVRTYRNHSQRQRVSGLNVRILTGNDLISDVESHGGNDVTLVSVDVLKNSRLCPYPIALMQ